MLEKYTPDIDAYLSYWIELSVLTQSKLELESALDKLRAQIILNAVEGQAKPPSMAQMERTILLLGSTPEERQLLDKYRQELQAIEGHILQVRGSIKAEEMKQAMFQTVSANARNVLSLEGV